MLVCPLSGKSSVFQILTTSAYRTFRYILIILLGCWILLEQLLHIVAVLKACQSFSMVCSTACDLNTISRFSFNGYWYWSFVLWFFNFSMGVFRVPYHFPVASATSVTYTYQIVDWDTVNSTVCLTFCTCDAPLFSIGTRSLQLKVLLSGNVDVNLWMSFLGNWVDATIVSL